MVPVLAKKNWHKPVDCNGDLLKVGDRVLILEEGRSKCSIFRVARISKIVKNSNKWDNPTKGITDHTFYLEYPVIDIQTKKLIVRKTYICQHNFRVMLMDESTVRQGFIQDLWREWVDPPKPTGTTA